MSLVADTFHAFTAATATATTMFGYPASLSAAVVAPVGKTEMDPGSIVRQSSSVVPPTSPQPQQQQRSGSDSSSRRTMELSELSMSRSGLNPKASAFLATAVSSASARPCEKNDQYGCTLQTPSTEQLPVSAGSTPPCGPAGFASLPISPLLSPPRLHPSNGGATSDSDSFSSTASSVKAAGSLHMGSPEESNFLQAGSQEGPAGRTASITPSTPPQQRVLPMCSPPALQQSQPNASSDPPGSAEICSDLAAASQTAGPPGRSSSATKAPFTLSLALSDAISRNSLPEVLAGLDNGLSPDSSVLWCPPGNGPTAAPVERSLLALAAFYGSKDILVQLLARGANPNLASCDDGMTPLHTAAAGHNSVELKSDIIHRLLTHGANRDAVDLLGRRPVELLVQQQGRDALNQAQMQQHMQQIAQNPHLDESFEDYGVIVGPHVPNPSGSSELADINRPEYSTDEFRINCFKVLRCSKTCAHDWTECPFVHPGEKARRRSPQKFTYSCSACPDFRKGVCRRGDLCGFSHGVFECWLHPARYRTQMCKDGAHCTRRVCFFAHSVSELRIGALPAAGQSPDSTLDMSGELSPTSPSCSSPLFSPTALGMRQMPQATDDPLADIPQRSVSSFPSMFTPLDMAAQQAQLPSNCGPMLNIREYAAAAHQGLLPTVGPRRHSEGGGTLMPPASLVMALRRLSMQGEQHNSWAHTSSLYAGQQSLDDQQVAEQRSAVYLQQVAATREAQQLDLLRQAGYSLPPPVSSPVQQPVRAMTLPQLQQFQTAGRGLSAVSERQVNSGARQGEGYITRMNSAPQGQDFPGRGAPGNGQQPRRPPGLPVIHQLKTQEGPPDSPDMSRVGSLSSLDVSWVDDLTGRKDASSGNLHGSDQ